MENVHKKVGFVCLILSSALFLLDYFKNSKQFNNLGYAHELHMLNYSKLTDDNSALKIGVIKAGTYTFKLNNLTRVYELNSKPVIWFYWNNESVPDFAKLLMESTVCMNPTFEVLLVTLETIEEFWPDYPKSVFSKLSPNHQSDMFRVHVLRTFGGVYLDADTFVVSSLVLLYEKLSNYDLVAMDWKPEGAPMTITSLGPTRAESELFKIWSLWQESIIRIKTDKLLKSKWYPFAWSEFMSYISNRILAHFLDHNLIRYLRFDGVSTVGQGEFSDVFLPLNSSIYSSFIVYNPTPFLYFDAPWGKVRNMSVSELLNTTQETVYQFFVKCPLNYCYDDFASGKSDRTKLTGLYISDLMMFLQKSRLFSLYPCFDRKTFDVNNINYGKLIPLSKSL